MDQLIGLLHLAANQDFEPGNATVLAEWETRNRTLARAVNKTIRQEKLDDRTGDGNR